MSFYGLTNVKEYFQERMEYYRNAVDMISVIDEHSPELWIDNTHELGHSFQCIHSPSPYHARALVDYRRYGAKVTASLCIPFCMLTAKESLVKFIRLISRSGENEIKDPAGCACWVTF